MTHPLVVPPTDTQIQRWKKAAKKIVRSTPDVTHTEALNRVAREAGYQDGWHGVVKALRGKA